jgi:hypothetical protein
LALLSAFRKKRQIWAVAGSNVILVFGDELLL